MQLTVAAHYFLTNLGEGSHCPQNQPWKCSVPPAHPTGHEGKFTPNAQFMITAHGAGIQEHI